MILLTVAEGATIILFLYKAISFLATSLTKFIIGKGYHFRKSTDSAITNSTVTAIIIAAEV